MNREAHVEEIEIFEKSCQDIVRIQQDVTTNCERDRQEAIRVLEGTQKELAYSVGLLEKAIAYEEYRLQVVYECEAEVDAAATGLPETLAWYTAACVRLADARGKYEKAVAHRKKMERRVEMAKQCVAIATEMFDTLQMRLQYSQNAIGVVADRGLYRMTEAYAVLGKYRIERVSGKDAKKFSGEGGNTGADNAEKYSFNARQPLTKKQIRQIKRETGWSDKIVSYIQSWEQYEIYKNANLHEGVINGRPCLLKDIDLNYVDPKTGKTNADLMKEGRPPYDAETGERIELHHMGQGFDSPFVELCENSEHGDGNDTILHDKSVESWRQNSELKNKYNNSDRPNHWKQRVTEG